MTLRHILRAIGWLVSELVPWQAIRVARGRDYDYTSKRSTEKWGDEQ